MADISTPNLDYNDMLEAWDINDALMGGTLEMRRQGENYLPKWPNEDEDAYKKRLSVATLLPVYEESIKQNIGRIFAEPTVLSEETPAKIREYAENIDMEGSRLDVWAQQFFSLAFQYGVAHALPSIIFSRYAPALGSCDGNWRRIHRNLYRARRVDTL